MKNYFKNHSGQETADDIQMQASRVNTMISDLYEVYHVKDMVDQSQTLYHYHDCYEIHATLEGKGIFYIDGEQFTIEPGMILLIPSHKMHRIVKQETDYFERVYIFITSTFLSQYSTKSTNLEKCFFPAHKGRARVLKSNIAELKMLLTKITTPIEKKQFGADIEFEQGLVNYILFINRLVQSNTNELEPNGNLKNERIELMIQYISDHLDDSLSLKDMEKVFFVSKYYITREFKKHTGYTFHQFVLKKRLLYSKYLLKKEKNASLIYSECGFTSYSHFLKAFKKEFKMTPKQFLNAESETDRLHFEHFENRVL